jgi:hypothetical protein
MQPPQLRVNGVWLDPDDERVAEIDRAGLIAGG